jgi:hypothetical protein
MGKVPVHVKAAFFKHEVHEVLHRKNQTGFTKENPNMGGEALINTHFI